jgi:photosystem II stability/assembly factor-like uncharacterized protein
MLCVALLLMILPQVVQAQFNEIPTAISTPITTLIKRNNHIFLGDQYQYLAKSSNNCATLIPIVSPSQNNLDIRVLDTNNIYIREVVGTTTRIYHSNDGGLTWQKFLDVDTLVGGTFQMFDTTNGVILFNQQISLRTADECATWLLDSHLGKHPYNSTVFADSTILQATLTPEVIFVSTNRAKNWVQGIGFPYLAQFRDIFILDATSYFTVLSAPFNERYLSNSNDGGLTWSNKLLDLEECRSVLFVNQSEGYIVGRKGIYGTVFKTLDTGNTWQVYQSNLVGDLIRMVFLNDSIALVSGADGYLATWNKNSVPNALGGDYSVQSKINMHPNPCISFSTLEITTNTSSIINVCLYNALGQKQKVIYNAKSSSTHTSITSNLSDLPSGIYFYVIKINGTVSIQQIDKM